MNERNIARWIMFAERDLEEGEHSLSEENAVFEFHQSTEKYLKACLALKGEEIRKTRDIAGLVLKCAVHDTAFHQFADFAPEMTKFSTRYRYPGDSEEDYVETGEMQKAGAFAQEVRKFVRSKIPQQIVRLSEQLRQSKPKRGLDTPLDK